MCSFLLPCQSSSDVRTYVLPSTETGMLCPVCGRPLVRVMHYSDTRPSAPALLPLDPKSSSRSPSFGTHPIEDWGVTDGAMLSREAAILCSPISLPVCLRRRWWSRWQATDAMRQGSRSWYYLVLHSTSLLLLHVGTVAIGIILTRIQHSDMCVPHTAINSLFAINGLFTLLLWFHAGAVG